MWTQKGQEEGGVNWESSTDIYTLPYVKQRASGSWYIAQGAHQSTLWWPRGVEWGWEVQGGGDVCTDVADSLCCRTEMETIMWSNYTPIKK